MSTARPVGIGLYTFGELTADPNPSRPIHSADRVREFMDLAGARVALLTARPGRRGLDQGARPR
jgi:hypothetical protein